jgi:DUF2075 family protein
MTPPRHLKLILLCSQTIPVFTRQRNTNVVFSVNCNAGWNIKIYERKIQAIYFSEDLRVLDDVLQLKRRDITFVNNVTYLGVTFNRSMTWRHHIERTVAKALGTYVRTYSLFKSLRLNTNIKLTLCRAVIKSVMTCLLHLGVRGGRSALKTAAPAEQSTPRYWRS